MSAELEVSRRRTLRSAGIGALTGISGFVAGTSSPQGRIVLPGVIATPEQWGNDVSGFFVHVNAPVDPAQAQVADKCEFADWDPSRTRQYDALLIDRIEEEHESTEIPLYVPDRVDIKPGALFVINRVHQCESGYTGIELENIVADFVVEDTGTANVTSTETETEATTPGFTIVTGLAGITGAGILLRWLQRQR